MQQQQPEHNCHLQLYFSRRYRWPSRRVKAIIFRRPSILFRPLKVLVEPPGTAPGSDPLITCAFITIVQNLNKRSMHDNLKFFNNYQKPMFFIDFQGSLISKGLPFCKSSMEILSGDLMKAIRPSFGGLLIITPSSFSF